MPKPLSNRRLEELRERLLVLDADYRDRKFLETDPVYFVHRYEDPRDQETVGFLSALLAFGNVKTIHGSISRLLGLLGPHPFEAVRDGLFSKDLSVLRAMGHRWVRGEDLHRLLKNLQRLIHEHDSLRNFFKAHDRCEDLTIGPLLERAAESFYRGEFKKTSSRGYAYFFPSPRDGSPCKRLAMFLRWMARPRDGIDLGLWPEIAASRLVLPVDTHLYRFGRMFRLSRLRSPSWKFALELTEFLKRIDPSDPVRFDFPICHYGMTVGWGK